MPNNNKHIIYVWLDALTNYISALDYFEKNNKNQFWPADVHIIGKDIIRFHCVYWPAFLLAAGYRSLQKKFLLMVGYFLEKKKCLNQREIF